MKGKKIVIIIIAVAAVVVLAVLGVVAFNAINCNKGSVSASSEKVDKGSEVEIDTGSEVETDKGIDLEEVLLQDYDQVKDKFGKEPSKVEEYEPEPGGKIYTYGELQVTVVPNPILNFNQIDNIEIDYNKTEKKNNYCVRQINGNDSLDDVIKELGTPEHDEFGNFDGDSEAEYREIGYPLQEQNMVLFYFDKDNKLIYVRYFDIAV